MKNITIHCECGRYYELDHSRIKKVREQYIKYAVCPHCGRPRDPKMADEIKKIVCSECHRPSKKLKKGLCTSHYIKSYRQKKVSLKSSNDKITSITTISHAIQQRNWYPRGNAESRRQDGRRIQNKAN